MYTQGGVGLRYTQGGGRSYTQEGGERSYTQEGRGERVYIPLGIASWVCTGVYIASLYIARSVHARHAVIDCSFMTVLDPSLAGTAVSEQEKTVLSRREEERRGAKTACFNPVLRKEERKGCF